MTLKLIGAGFGRTGTTSVKFAYEQLGLGRCYHMLEVFQTPGAAERWVDAADGKPDWDALLGGYTASVDWPGCAFWRELLRHCPEAKVLLTVREPNSWFDSTQRTIFSDRTRDELKFAPGIIQLFSKVVDATFDGRLHDRAHCISVFERHNADVIRSVPKEKLLVYDVAEGWGPLCRFLGVPAPAAPFPKASTSEDFVKRDRGTSPRMTSGSI
jgi:hypothetical protein